MNGNEENQEEIIYEVTLRIIEASGNLPIGHQNISRFLTERQYRILEQMIEYFSEED